MSTTLYNKAFSATFGHNFYQAANLFQVNRDLEILPTDECAQLMSNGRMHFVRTSTGFTVFYKAYLDAMSNPIPFVELTGTPEFVFSMRINNGIGEFLNVTDLNIGGTYSSGKIILFDGLGNGTTPYTLIPSLVDQLRPSIFTYSFQAPLSTVMADVYIYSESDPTNPVAKISNVPQDSNTGIFNVPVDLSAFPKGKYHLLAYKFGTTTPAISDALIYVDSILASQGVFGIIRLNYAAADLYSNPTVFNYTFANRSVKWRYYISVKNVSGTYFYPGLGNHNWAITDTAPSNPYIFDAQDPPGVPNGTFKINGFETVIFSSHAPIPFSETAYTTLQLVEQVGTGDPKVLINNLRNASVTGVDSNRLNPTSPGMAEIFIILDSVS